VDGYANYFDAEQVAQILGVTRKDIFAWREQGVAAPAITRLIEQFDRAGLARLAVYALLRDLMGDRTSRPRWRSAAKPTCGRTTGSYAANPRPAARAATCSAAS
jgi:hypothetical protein